MYAGTDQDDMQHSGSYIAHEITGGYRENGPEAYPKLRFIIKKLVLYLLPTATLVYIISISSVEISHKSSWPVFDVTSLFGTLIICLSGATFILLSYGIFKHKQYDVYASFVLLFAIEVYTAVEYSSDINRRTGVKTAQLILLGITSLVMAFLSPLTIRDENWKEFRIVGVSAWLLDMYRERCYFMTLLRVDCCIAIIFGLFALFSYQSTVELWPITITACVYSLIVWALGTYSVLKENKIMLFVFICLSLLYLFWIPSQIFVWKIQSIKMDYPLHKEPVVLYCAIATGIVAAIMRIYVSAEVNYMYKNFGNGLSDQGFALLLSPESASLLAPP